MITMVLVVGRSTCNFVCLCVNTCSAGWWNYVITCMEELHSSAKIVLANMHASFFYLSPLQG